MDGPGEYYANEIIQTERQKCHMISLTCGQTELTRKIETDS